jgi:phosphoribosylaminoimidazole (AIR) synthetase
MGTSASQPGATYQAAGVDNERADLGLKRIVDRVRQTWPQGNELGALKLDIGHYASVIDAGGIGLAITTDGIGSKAIIAQMVDRYDTVGIDCVAMNVNDLICVGATPRKSIPFWSYFCQRSDSTTSYGSYSGAVPNEKITWGKLDIAAPKFIIESDASIVAPLIFAKVLGW